MNDYVRMVAEVEQEKDGLVRLAREACDGVQAERIPETGQLFDLRNVASSTSSVEELKLHVRHQMARDRRWKDGGFGEAVLRRIESLESRVADREKLALMVRLFIGYAVRYAYFLKRCSQSAPKPPRPPQQQRPGFSGDERQRHGQPKR